MVKTLYVFAFSTTILFNIHFYFEENGQHGFFVFFPIISMLLDGVNIEWICLFFKSVSAHHRTGNPSINDALL